MKSEKMVPLEEKLTFPANIVMLSKKSNKYPDKYYDSYQIYLPKKIAETLATSCDGIVPDKVLISIRGVFQEQKDASPEQTP